MHLTFMRRHLSIAAFPDITLPPLTVVLGPNGVGKSHLLQAIAGHAIENDISPAPQNPVPPPSHGMTGDILLLANGIAPPDAGNQAYNTPTPNPSPDAMLRPPFREVRAQALRDPAANLAAEFGEKLEGVDGESEDIWALGPEEAISRLPGLEPDAQMRLRELFHEAEHAIVTLPPDSASGRQSLLAIQQRNATAAAARKSGMSPLAVTEDDLALYAPWGQAEQFQANMATVFGRYRDIRLRNQLRQIEDQKTGSSKSLTDEAFERIYGQAPWLQLAETFASFGLRYEPQAPSQFDYAPVGFVLKRIPGGEEVSTGSLSSGEKVLLQFALSSFEFDEHFYNVRRPKVLLLDEMDASLHPEMVHRWLRVISDGLVAEQGIHCLLTTHSPTTVALAPEEALYEMRDGGLGLAKISKQGALNKLTFGVPTLSIDYSGRRQVFTESDTDAPIYESVYALIKSYMHCEKELNFLSTGLRDKDNGEINAGCTIVKQTVDRLAELGNSSIFGIIDWDGDAVSTDRIKVVAEGERNGIENVLLDPLLVALLLMKERRLPEGLQDIDRFTGASSLGPPDLQRLIDAIQIPLFPDATERVEVSYIGGAKGNVFRAYLEADDHDLEESLCAKFDGLKQWHPKGKGRGTLVKIVVEHVLAEHTGFCPTTLPAVFEAIANAPN